MKKATTTKPTVGDMLTRMQQRPCKFTPDQHEQIALAIAHNDSEPNLKRRIGTVPLHRMLVEHYGYAASRTTMEMEAARAFGRRSWARP